MQQVFELLQSLLREAVVQLMGTRGTGLQSSQSFCRELVDGIANRLLVASQMKGDGGDSFSTG